MKLSDYMNPEKFPLTSQKGLSARQQLMIDAFNLDSGTEALENGVQFDQEDQAIRKELEEKGKYRKQMLAELDKQEKAAIAK